MRLLPVDATNDLILAAVREWVDLLAAGDFASAVEFLHPPPADATAWTPESLATYISNYGWWEPLDDGRTVRVTPIASATGDHAPIHEVYASNYGPRTVDFQLPLDGEWSDLFAYLHIIEIPDGWALYLWALRVP